MGLSQRDMIDIEGEGYNALSEYLASCTVIITSETENFQHGTGVAVRHSDHDYILTARHVLDGEPDNEKIMIIGRTAAPHRDVQKSQLAGAFFKGTQDRETLSYPTHINIIHRLMSKNSEEDIAALKVQNTKSALPHTVFHDLSGQGETQTSLDAVVILGGFPGELTLQAEHRVTRQRGAAAFFYFSQQIIKKTSDAPEQLDPNIDFVTDFIDDDNACKPRGMSGCGVWSIPRIKAGQIWSPHESQLLGIQVGFYPKSKLLRCVRIERVLHLLSGK